MAACKRPTRLPRPWPSSAVDFQLHLETETVEHCHPSKPLVRRPTDSVRTVLRMLQAERTGAAMICTDGRLSWRFYRARRPAAASGRRESRCARVGGHGSQSRHGAKNRYGGKAISLMSVGGFRRLPIVDDQGQGRRRAEGFRPVALPGRAFSQSRVYASAGAAPQDRRPGREPKSPKA